MAKTQKDVEVIETYTTTAEVEAPVMAKIVPTVEKSIVPVEVAPAFEVAPGNYHLVRLDAAGNEIPGSDFQIGAFNAEKSYIPYPTKYKVKKSPSK